MSDIVIYDESTRQVTNYIKSANTPEYSSRTDVLINPNVSALSGVPIKYWKESGGSVVEMTQAEKDAVDTALATDQLNSAKTSSKQEYDSRHMKAFVKVLIDEINTLRALHSLPDRTTQQLKTAVENEIDGATQ